MATTSKYIISRAGLNYLDLSLNYGTLTLQGEEIVFSGGASASAVDAVFVRPGVTVDMTNSKAGQDKIYLEGNWSDYAISLNSTSGVMTLTRGTGSTLEKVMFVKTGTGTSGLTSSDVLVFRDGTVNSLDIYNKLNQSLPLSGLTPVGETSVAPIVPASQDADLKVIGVKATTSATDVGDTFSSFQPGVKLVIAGTGGVDRVYIQDGTYVDASNLKGGTDIVYMRGTWDSYSKAANTATGFITLTRTVTVNSVSQTETVILGGTTGSQKDQYVFADGAVMADQAWAALRSTSAVNGGTTFGLSITKADLALRTVGTPPASVWDGTTTTPGLSDVQSIAIDAASSTGGQNNFYNANDTIVFTVTMKSAVDVDTTNGTPRLKVTLDNGATAWATYDSTLTGGDTNKTALKFKYTVGNTDTDTNGVSIAAGGASTSAIDVNSGHIYKTGTTTDAKITQSPALADQASYKVDTTPPTVTDANISLQGATGTSGFYKSGDVVTAVIDPTTNTDINTVTVDFTAFGGGSAVAAVLQTNGPNSGKWVATYTIASNSVSGSNLNVSATVVDNAGHSVTVADTSNASVDAVVPLVADANITFTSAGTGTAGAYRVNDNVTVVFDPVGNADLASVTVDFTAFGGGSAVAATLQTSGPNAGKYVATAAVLVGSIDVANAKVSVTATDTHGNTTTTQDGTSLVVDNQAPVVSASAISFSGATGANGAYKAGDTITAVFDPAGNTDLSAVTVNFADFGGGSAVAATLQNSGPNTGKYVATYTLVNGSVSTSTAKISVNATDDAGNATSAQTSTTATVDTSAPTLTITSDKYSLLSGQSATITFTFSEEPVGFTLSDITPSNGSFNPATLQSTADPKVFTATFVADNTGTTNLSGSFALSGSFTDAVGNTGILVTPASIAIPPSVLVSTSITSITDNVAWDGTATTATALTAGESTNDTTLTLNGSVGQSLTGSQLVHIYDTVNGVTTRIGSVAASGTTWTFTTSALPAGLHSLSARVEDSSTGAVGASSTAFAVRQQSVAISGFVDNVGSVQGAVALGGSTDDTTPGINGTVAIGLGTNEVVGVYASTDSGTTWTRLGDAIVSGTTWSLTPSAALSSYGAYTLRAVVEPTSTTTNTPATTAKVASAAATLTVTDPAAPPTAVVTSLVATDDQSSSNTTYTGALTANTSTDDTVLALSGTYSGTLATGEVIEVFDGALRLGTASYSGGTWNFNTGTLSNGAHTFSAKVTNTSNNISSTSTGSATGLTVVENGLSAINLTVDTGTINGSTITDTTPTINGSLNAALGSGDVLAVYVGSTKVGTATVQGSSWNYTFGVSDGLTPGTPSAALAANASYTVNVKIEDAAGTQVRSLKSSTFTVQGTTAPTAAVTGMTVTDDVGTNGSDTGALANNSSTDDTILAFSGTYSGSLGSNEVIQIIDTVNGASTVIGSTTGSGGTWTYTSGTQSTGAHAYTARVTNTVSGLSSTAWGSASNTALNVVENTLGAVGVTVDVGTYSAGTLVDATPTLSGTLGTATLATGETLAVYDGSTRLGTASISGTTWTFRVGTDGDSAPHNADLSVGSHTLKVQIEDGSNTARLVQSVALNVQANTAPTAVVGSTLTITDDVGTATQYVMGNYTGALSNNQNTDDTVLTISGTYSNTLGANEVIRILDNGNVIGSTTGSGGSWSYTTGTQSVGSHSYSAQVINTASGQTTTASNAVTVVENSLSAPAISVDQGSLVGMARYVLLRYEGANTWTGLGEIAAMSNGTNVALGKTVTSNVSSVWGLSKITDGDTSAYQSGLAANSQYSTVWVQVDLGANYALSSVVVSNLNFGTGSAKIYTSLSPLSSYTMSQLAAGSGNATDLGVVSSSTQTISMPTNATVDTTPTLSGTLGADLGSTDVLAVYQNGTRIGTASVAANKTWSFRVGTDGTSSALTAGNGYAFKVQIEDGSQNVRMATSKFINVIQASIPTAVASSLSITDDVATNGSFTGTLSNNSSTDDASLTLSGNLTQTLAAGEVVNIYDAGVLIGSVTVTAGGTTWTYAAAATAGTHTYTAKVVDTATGGASTSTGSALAGVSVVENTLSQATIASVHAGKVVSGSNTDDTAPTLTGTVGSALGSADVLGIYIDGTRVGTVTPNGSGQWSFAVGTDGTSAPLSVGAHTVKVQIENAGGTEARVVQSSTLTVLAGAAPSTTTSLTVSDDVATNSSYTGVLTTNSSTDDSVLSLSGTLTTTLGSNEVVQIFDGGVLIGSVTTGTTGWTYTTSPQSVGAHSYTARVANTFNGLFGTASTAVNVIENSLSAVNVAVDQGKLAAEARYVLLRYEGANTWPGLGEIAAMSNGTNVALGKPVTSNVVSVYGLSKITDGDSTVAQNGLAANSQYGTVWVQVDLGASYIIDSIVVSNLGFGVGSAKVYTSQSALSGFTLSQLDAGSGGATALGVVSSTTAELSMPSNATNPVVVDATPSLNGTLGDVLGLNEVVGVYFTDVVTSTTTRFDAVVTPGSKVWSFTPGSALAAGNYTVKVQIEDASHTQARVVQSSTLKILPATAPVAVVDSFSLADNSSATTSYSANYSGTVASGGDIDATKPIFSGTVSQPLASGDVVRIFDTFNGITSLIGQASVSGTGWTFTPGAAMALGQHSFTAQVFNPVANLGSTATTPYIVTINTLATIGMSVSVGETLSGSQTTDTTPTFSGGLGKALGAGDVIGIYVDGLRLGTASVSGTSWTFTPASGLASGTHQVTAQIETASTGDMRLAQTQSFTIVPASAPTATISTLKVSDAVGSYSAGDFTGDIVSGASINDARPVVSGTLSAGGLQAGEVVQVLDGATVLGTATVNGTSWSFATSTLSAGLHSLSARVANALSGTANTVGNAAAVDVRVNALGAIVMSSSVGETQLGTSTTDTTPTFSGTLGSEVLGTDVVGIYIDGIRKGAATLSGTGANTTWTFTPAALIPGNHTVKVQLESAGGEMRMAQAMNFSVADSGVPVALVNALSVVDDVSSGGSYAGVLANNSSTDDATLTFNGGLSQALGAGEVVQVFDGSTLLGTATVNGTTWTYTSGTQSTGAHAYTAKVTNTVSGLSSTAWGSASNTALNVVENTLGAVGVTVDVGTYSAGTLVDATPTLSGTLGTATLATGETLAVYDGSTRLGTASISGTTWTFRVGTDGDSAPHNADLSVGSHTLKVQIEDGSNTARLVQSVALNVQANTAPTAVVGSTLTITDDVGTATQYVMGNYTGALSNNQNTDDTVLTISGTYSNTLGANEVIRILDNGNVIGSTTGSGGSWSYTTGTQSVGSHSYSAQVINTASGQTTTASNAVTVVENSLSAPAISVDQGSLVGMARYVLLRYEGANTWTGLGEIAAMSNGTNVALGKTVTSNVSSVWGLSKITDGDTSAYQSGLAANSQYSTVWVQVDLGANYALSSVVVSNLNFGTGSAKIYTSLSPLSSYTMSQLAAGSGNATDLGVVSSSTQTISMPTNATVDTTPTLSGTLATAIGSADVVAIYDGSTRLGTASVSGTAWRFRVGTDGGSALAVGDHVLKVQIEDGSQNVRMATSKFLSVMATAAPSAVVSTITATDDVAANGSFTGVLASNSSTDDGQLALSGTLTSALSGNESVQVFDGVTFLGVASVSGTNWSFTTPNLSAGSHTLSAKVVDAMSGLSSAAKGLTVVESSLAMTGSLGYLAQQSAQLLVAGATVAGLDLAGLQGTMGGANASSNLAASIILDSGASNGTRSFWLAQFDGATTKAVQVRLVDTLAGVSAQVLQAKSTSGNVLDGSFNFNTDGSVQSLAQTASQAGFGVAGLAVKQAATTPLTGTLGAALSSNEALGVYVDGVRVGAVSSFSTKADGTVAWSYTPSLSAGSHTVSVQVEDATSHVSRLVASRTLTVTGGVPAATVVTLVATDTNSTGYAAGDYVGVLSGGMSSDSSTPLVSGTLSAALNTGEQVRIYDGTVLLGTATVSGLTWSFVAPTLAAGTHTLSAKVSNADASLVSTSTAAPVSFTVSSLGWNTLAADSGNAKGNLLPGSTPTATTVGCTDGTPLLGGTLGAALGSGEQVGVYDNGVFLGTAAVSGSSWTFVPSSLAAGLHVLQVRVEDSATRTTRMALSQNVEILDSALIPSTVVSTFKVTDANTGYGVGLDASGTLVAGSSTNDTRPAISGTLSAGLLAGEVVQVFDGATLLGSASVNGFNWSYTPSATQALSVGSHTLSAKVVNTATGIASAAMSQTVIEQAMSGITVTPHADSAQTGSLVRYVMVRRTTASADYFDVADIQVTVNGVNIAAGKTVTGSDPALAGTSLGNVTDSVGTTSRTPYITATPTTDGWVQVDLGGVYNVSSVTVVAEGTYEQYNKVANAYVLASASDMSGTSLSNLLLGNGGAVTLGQIPATQANPSVSPSFTMPATAVAPITTANSATVSGKLLGGLGTGEQLGVYVKNGSGSYVFMGTATVSGNGDWSASLSGLATGVNTVKAQVEDGFGTVRLAQTQTLTVASGTLGATVGSTITVTDNVGVYTGGLASGTSTDDNVLVVSGTITGTQSSTQIVQVLDNGTVIGTATVSGSAWTYTTDALSAGSHSLTARVYDKATSTAGTASSAVSFTENTIGSLSITPDSGPAQLNGTVRYIMLRQNGTSNVFNLADLQVMSGGQNVALNKKVVSNYAFNVGLPENLLVDGSSATYAESSANTTDLWVQVDLGANYAIDAVNLAARSGFLARANNLYVFTSANDMSAMSLATLTGGANGTVGNLGLTNFGSSQSLSLAALATTGVDTTPTFSGSLAADLGVGQVVGVYVDGTRLGTASISGTGASTTWSYTPGTALTTGGHTLAVKLEQGAGGTSLMESSKSFTISSAATQDVLNLSAVTSTAASADTVSLTGYLSSALVAGQKLAIYDGAPAVDGSNLIGYANVNAGASSFSYTATGLGIGAHTLQARVLNVDGTAGSGAVGVANATTVMASAPTQVVTVLGALKTAGTFSTNGAVIGNSVNVTDHRWVTDDTTPGLYGILSSTLGAGESLKAYVDGVEASGTLTVNGTTWNFTPGTALTDGYHDLSFKVVNSGSGTAGAISSTFRVEVDAVVDNKANIISATDSVGPLTGSLGNGDTTDAYRVSLYGTFDSLATGVVKVYDGGNYVGSTTVTNSASWGFVTDALSESTHSFTAKFVNAAGVEQTATPTPFTLVHAAQDGVLSNVTTSVGVDTASLTFWGQTLDFTKFTATDIGKGIDKVNLGSFGGSTVKLSTADVLEAGTGLFTSGSGWSFANAADATHASTYHQMVMAGTTANGGASTVQIAEVINASNSNPWALTGTASNGGQTYNVYTNLETNNAQLLIDQRLAVAHVVL